FWSAVLGGWIIALMAWMVTASRWTMAQVLVIWVMTYLVGAAGFAHSIAGAGEVLSAVLDGRIPAGDYGRWLLPATLGNVVGGVVMVSLLNYSQVVVSG